MKHYCFHIGFSFLFWIFILHTGNFIFAQSYAVDIEKSKIYWTGWKQLFGNKVSQKGELKFSSGSIYVEKGTFANALLTMDMNSISHLNDGKVYTSNDVVTHLKSESCFFVGKYSDTVFRLKKAESQTPISNYHSRTIVTGTLTIKGITKTLSFPVSITQTKQSLIITAAFQISREAFNLDLEPFLIRIGGDKIVRDNIDITVEILARSRM